MEIALENLARLSATLKLQLPQEIVEQAGWRPGQLCTFEFDGARVCITAVAPAQGASASSEMLKRNDKPTQEIDEEEVDRDEWQKVRGLMRGADPEDYRDRDDRY